MSVILVINVVDEAEIDVPIKERFSIETLSTVMINFDGEKIKDYDEIVNSFVGMIFILTPQRSWI